MCLMTICLKDVVYILLCQKIFLHPSYANEQILILLQRYITITLYFTSGHQSSPCKGTCTDVIRIQTQNDFCCFPSVTFEPLHYLLNFRVFYINFCGFFHMLELNYCLSVYKDLMRNVSTAEYHIYGYFVIFLPILAKNWLPWQCPQTPAIRNVFFGLADHENPCYK